MIPRRIAFLCLAPAVILVLTHCSGGTGDSHGALQQPDVRLAGSDLLINGQSVNNAAIPPGSGTSTLFTATLVDPADTSRMRSVEMDYPVHSSMGMMGDRSTLRMYDDGTHGDLTRADGVYSYLDIDGHIGPHGDDCPRGQYLYRFHGTDLQGHDTNWVECNVTVR